MATFTNLMTSIKIVLIILWLIDGLGIRHSGAYGLYNTVRDNFGTSVFFLSLVSAIVALAAMSLIPSSKELVLRRVVVKLTRLQLVLRHSSVRCSVPFHLWRLV